IRARRAAGRDDRCPLHSNRWRRYNGARVRRSAPRHRLSTPDPMSPAAAPVATSAARNEPALLGGLVGGPRFAVRWLPGAREPLGSVLCVQPIGAERAAARHALAAQAWRLARLGWAVLLLDLFGTG